MEPPVSSFRRCSSCKKEIGFGADYWVCNVSTCNQKRTGLAFCTVSCWEAHLPVMRHRESWAVEKKAPRREEWEREQREAAAKVTGATGTPKAPPPGAPPVRRAAAQPATPAAAPPRPTPLQPVAQREVLVVASKLKQYVRDRSGMNTSDAVMDVLSEALRTLADRAIRNAERDGRKTVLDRDFPKSV
ncbi:MAG TPA: hypothetical protein VMW35_11325 [Myxococcota bacterium]|jgi:hypothetical protein|nr:hypothetical protein [Myxococcota bacterium]